jgi:hypothetical protein
LRRVFGWDPNGLILSGADMPQAGKGNVGGGDPHSLLDGLGEDHLACRLSLLWIGVVFDGNGGIGKLDSGDVDDVTPDQKRLAVALNHVASVSGRMPRGWDRAYARYEFLAAVEREEYAGGYVRFQRGLISFSAVQQTSSIGHSRASQVPTELNNSERTGLRLGTERHCSFLVECQRLFRDPAPPAFAPVRGFGGDGGRRRSKPNEGS